MRIVLLLILNVAFCSVSVGSMGYEDQKDAPAKGKANADRLAGMKAAVADIEAGKLKLKFPPFPDSPQQRNYYELLEKECGVESQVVAKAGEPGKARDEMDAYNAIMRMEIEYRFPGTLDKLWTKAGEIKK